MKHLAALLFAAWVGLNGLWLGQDLLPRDGDEEGHVGAAELFMVDLREGRLQLATERLLVQDMGDYPSLYPALTGAWWAALGGGDPGRPAVRALNLFWLLVAGAAVAATAARAGADPGSALLGGAATLWLPLNSGLARHFMPEGLLVATVALAVLAAAWQRERPTLAPAIGLGLVCGLGLLTKQTFVLYALLPVLVLVRWRWTLLAVPAAALLLSGPWLFNNLGEQAAYASASTGYPGGFGQHLAFYPMALWSPGLGPVWLLGGGAALVIALRGPLGRLAAFAGIWLVGGLLVLVLVPKKYERLVAPLLPAMGLVVASAAVRRPRAAAVGVLLGAGWTGAASFAPLAQPTAFSQDFHPGCTQVWLRPPVQDDWGLSALAEASRQAGPGDILMRGEPPPIPCAVQTTHPWESHVSPYLRRMGLDRELVTQGGGPIVLVWEGGGPADTVVELPSLNSSFALLRLTPVR